MYTAHLILLRDIFSAAVGLYDVYSFWCFCINSSTLHTSLARVQGFSLMVTTHNSTALKVNGMTEDILFVVLFGQKIFVSCHKKSFFHDPIRVMKIYSSSSWYFVVSDEDRKTNNV